MNYKNHEQPHAKKHRMTEYRVNEALALVGERAERAENLHDRNYAEREKHYPHHTVAPEKAV